METEYETLKKKIDENELIILDGGVGKSCIQIVFERFKTFEIVHCLN